MIKPTNGRVIWIRGRLGCVDDTQPETALITYVNPDGSINVRGWSAIGDPFALTNVHLHQEGEPRPAGLFAEWMPYQIGQAKKS